jgi:hypothetical protein
LTKPFWMSCEDLGCLQLLKDVRKFFMETVAFWISPVVQGLPARTAHADHKAQLENMADTWEQLAEARKKKLLSRGLNEDDGKEA